MSRFKIGNIKGPKGDKGETGAVGPKGEQGIQGPVGPAGGVNSVNGKTGNVDIVDALGYTPAGGQGVNLLSGVTTPIVLNPKEDFNVSVNHNYARIYMSASKVKKDETYTISADIEITKGDFTDLTFFLEDTKNIRITETIATPIKNKRIIHTFSIIKDCVSADLFLYLYAGIAGSTRGNGVIFSNIKIERGSTPTDWTPAPEDIVTKTPYDIFAALDSIPEMHRNLYGGRNLGESTQMSEAHKKAIQDGSFKDLWVGDYWTHEGINYRIADIDYFYNCGDTPFSTHHLVIVPDTCLGGNKPMNPTDSTENGYKGSDMHENVLPAIKTEFIDKAFPNMVLSHQEYLTNKVTSGYPSSREWVNATVELMNEIMFYGCPVFTPANNGTAIPALHTIGNSQLALFRLNPCMIKTRQNYWLRDVVSASDFASVVSYGVAYCASASSSSIGVRPYFCIGVQPSGDEADDDMEVVSPMQKGDYMEEGFE